MNPFFKKVLVPTAASEVQGLHTALSPEQIDEALADPRNQESLREAARVPYMKRDDTLDTADYWWDGVDWKEHPSLPAGDMTTWGRAELKQALIALGASEEEVNGQPIAELRKMHAKKAV